MKSTLAVVGLGYVGLPLAILAKQKGYLVTGIDIDSKKIKQIKEISTTDDFKNISLCQIIVICVPTPVYPNKLPDYGPVDSACTSVGRNLKPGSLVILESTVNPGYCQERAIPLLEKYSGLKLGKDFYFAHCPERIDPGNKKWHVGNIPRVLGASDQISMAMAVEFYRRVLSGAIKSMDSLMEAEAVKIVENSFRNVNIAFVNELAVSFSKLGINVVNVINGAATKPFSFLAHYPGCGVGGHCIPVDPHYLIDYSKRKTGFNHQLLELACSINDSMPEYTVQLLADSFKFLKLPLKGSTVAVLGLAYKGNIADIRESPSEKIISQLKKRSVKVKTFDPFLPGHSTEPNLTSALRGAQGVILATNHDAFKKITPTLLKKFKIKIIIDGKNFLPRNQFLASGLIYHGIGI